MRKPKKKILFCNICASPGVGGRSVGVAEVGRTVDVGWRHSTAAVRQQYRPVRTVLGTHAQKLVC